MKINGVPYTYIKDFNDFNDYLNKYLNEYHEKHHNNHLSYKVTIFNMIFKYEDYFHFKFADDYETKTIFITIEDKLENEPGKNINGIYVSPERIYEKSYFTLYCKLYLEEDSIKVQPLFNFDFWILGEDDESCNFKYLFKDNKNKEIDFYHFDLRHLSVLNDILKDSYNHFFITSEIIELVNKHKIYYGLFELEVIRPYQEINMRNHYIFKYVGYSDDYHNFFTDDIEKRFPELI